MLSIEVDAKSASTLALVSEDDQPAQERRERLRYFIDPLNRIDFGCIREWHILPSGRHSRIRRIKAKNWVLSVSIESTLRGLILKPPLALLVASTSI